MTTLDSMTEMMRRRGRAIAAFDSMDSMSGLDSMDSMSGLDSMGRGTGRGHTASVGATAMLVEHSRTNTVDIASPKEQREALLIPRGATETSLPEPGFDPDISRYDIAVRARLYDFELASALGFEFDGNAAATLTHREMKGTTQQIMRIARPRIELFKGQLAHVIGLTQQRGLRLTEILAELTPPYALWMAVANIDPLRTPRTMELIGCALRLASSVVQRFKHQFVCPRAIEYSPFVQPLIATPGHASFPSGHATEAFMVARLIAVLLGKRCPPAMDRQLQAQAARVGQNREVAGVHFPVDTMAGRLLGDTLAHYLAYRGQARTTLLPPRQFDAIVLYQDPAGEIDVRKWLEPGASVDYGAGEFDASSAAGYPPEQRTNSPSMPSDGRGTSAVSWLWDAALKEWQ
jgi:hypothetical protein